MQNMVSFAVGFISLGLSAESVHKGRRLLEAFHASLRACQTARPEDKAAALEHTLGTVFATIEKEGIGPLRKQLMISKRSSEELARRVNDLRDHIYSKKEISSEDTKFIKLLAGRAKTYLGFKVADIASSVGAIAGSALFLTPVPVVGQIVGAVILATTGAISLVSLAGRYFFVTKNPFDETPKNRAQEILSSLRNLKERLPTFMHGKNLVSAPVSAKP